MIEKTKLKIIFVGIILFVIPFFTLASSLGEKTDFFVGSEHDLKGRNQITAILQKITPRAYFYLEEGWWDIQDTEKQEEIEASLNLLAEEFENRIYPILTDTFGSEWKPGIDDDYRIVILFKQMKEKIAGYFRTIDNFRKLQAPQSNEREMVYLNISYIQEEIIKSYLAHEFMHLITFNQKDRLRGVTEEIWLNEARSEYVSTLLGYDDEYQGSNLQQRARKFVSSPSDSLTEWQNQKRDYGTVNLFIQYLVDHYGIEILVDSLKSSKVGIPSLNYALAKNGFEEDFAQIFTNWKIAIFLNDCQLGEKYCYLNSHLSELRIIPLTNFLPFVGRGTLAVTHTTKNWSANWHKFIGGKGVLKLEFNGYNNVNFKVPYVIEDLDGDSAISFLDLDENQDGEIYVPYFNTKNRSLTILPSIQDKVSGFNGEEESFSFSWTISIVERTPEQEAELIEGFLGQIKFLEIEIARIQAEINEILAARSKRISCQYLGENLFYGTRDNKKVKCLQEFLKAQGPEIYPQGLITGFFGSLTRSAVIRFQEKYAPEILFPLGLKQGSGFVGPSTRAKINRILGQ